MTDEALASFADRLRGTKPPQSGVAQFAQTLNKVSSQLSQALPATPFITGEHYKADGKRFIQFHWPLGGNDNGEGPAWSPPEEMTVLYNTAELANYLESNVDRVVQTFFSKIHARNIWALYQLECPAGLGIDPNRVSGALWCNPVRLVWDYNINWDTIIARFDILGEVKRE